MQANNLQSSLNSTAKANEHIDAEIKEMTLELSSQVIEFEKLKVRYESADSELKTVKAEFESRVGISFGCE